MPDPLLLKLSGEALGNDDGVLDHAGIDRVCGEIKAGLVAAPRPLALVVGGGNILRGGMVADRLADPKRGDYMGMLATLINALALKDGLERAGLQAEVVAPFAVPSTAHAYNRDQVHAWLAAGTIVIFGGGTGHPCFTTDTTAALRAAEIGAGELAKGSGVDGIYSADPRKDPAAERFETLTFDQALAGQYGVMDQTAFALCRAQNVPIRVFDMNRAGAITDVFGANAPGTLVTG